MSAVQEQTEERMMAALQEPPNPDFWLKLTEIIRESTESDRLGSDGNPNYTERMSSQLLLHRLIKLLMEQPYYQKREEQLTTLLRLSAGLFDLNHGRVIPALTPAPKKTNNRGDLAVHAMIKATAARAMSEYIDAKMSIEQAARKVSGALRSAGRRGLKGGNRTPGVTWKTVKGWRDELNQDGNYIASDAKRLAYTGPLGDDFGATAMERGDRLVEELRRLAPQLI